jgi:signal transduction histidine kinase
MQYSIFMMLAPLAAVVSIGVILYAWRFRAGTAMPALMVLLVAVSGWTAFNTLELGAQSPSMTVFWSKVSYPFIVLTPVAWLAFALQYTSRDAWLAPQRFWVACLVPLITLVLLATNRYHELIWEEITFVRVGHLLAMHVEHGLWFWVHTIYSYALVLVGALFIGQDTLRSFQLYRKQSIWLMAGALIPILANMVYVLDLIPALKKDYTSISFALAALCFAIGMFRYRLFDLRPVARTRVVDTINDAMYVLDPEGRIVDVNAAGVELLPGIEDELHAVGRPFQDFWSSFLSAFPLDEGDDTRQQDVTLEIAGASRCFDCRISPLDAQSRHPTGHLLLLRDITRRVRAEASLRYHMDELTTRNEQLDAFAHTVAHDIKSPLSTVIGYADMLRGLFRTMPDDEIEEHLGVIVNTSTRVTRIVDALLLLARVSRQEEVEVDVLDMGRVLDRTITRLADVIEQSGAKVGRPQAWPRVMGHVLWVEQVWTNYISNAIKYGGDPPTLEIGYDEMPDEEGVDGRSFVRFWVRDNGEGLSEAQRSKLFTPFTRLHTSRAKGHGLGLTIVRRIVTRLGGEVGVEPIASGGSRFWFTLPVPEARARETAEVGAVPSSTSLRRGEH